MIMLMTFMVFNLLYDDDDDNENENDATDNRLHDDACATDSRLLFFHFQFHDRKIDFDLKSHKRKEQKRVVENVIQMENN